MKNKPIQRGRISLLVAVLILQLMATPLSTKAQTDNQNQSDLSINTSCITEWDTFISSTISISDFNEYWKDIFIRYNRNTCYYMDIDSILRRIDTTRSQLRVAILGCKDDQVNLLKIEYYKLEIELDYLRNFVSFADKNGRLIPEEKVYSQLKEKYVDKKLLFTEEEFKKIFDKYKSKYKSRLASSYSKCQDASIQMLIKKWDHLVNTIKGMGADAKSLKEDFDNAINLPATGMKNFINNLKESGIEFVSRIKNTQELFNDLAKKTGSSPSLDTLQLASSQADQEHKAALEKATLTAKYKALYKYGGDSLANTYEKLLSDLNKTIEDSYKPLDSLKQCSKQSADKQCK